MPKGVVEAFDMIGQAGLFTNRLEAIRQQIISGEVVVTDYRTQ